jgi:hypothetical protein
VAAEAAAAAVTALIAMAVVKAACVLMPTPGLD